MRGHNFQNGKPTIPRARRAAIPLARSIALSIEIDRPLSSGPPVPKEGWIAMMPDGHFGAGLSVDARLSTLR